MANTGANGEYLHDTWRSLKAMYLDVGVWQDVTRHNKYGISGVLDEGIIIKQSIMVNIASQDSYWDNEHVWVFGFAVHNVALGELVVGTIDEDFYHQQ